MRLGFDGRPLPQELFVRVPYLLEQRAGLGVLPRGPGRRGRCEELEHAELVEPVREDVMPRVPAKQHDLAGLGHPDLAVLGVREDERPAEHEIGDVGAEDRSMRVRVEAFPA